MKRTLLLVAAVVGIVVLGKHYGWLEKGIGAYAEPPSIDARSALLMDAKTGTVYYESNADIALPPASVSKLMTELLVLEDVRAGKRNWKETVVISKYAANMPPSRIGLKAGDRWPLDELFQAMVVYSANDAAVALAEHLAVTERDFVIRMNEKAHKLGLSSKTVFANASGLSAADLSGLQPRTASGKGGAEAPGETVMTARDIAKLAQHLVNAYPEVLDITRMKEVTLASRNLKLETTNLMLPGKMYAYSGNDGLKTGFTDEAGYCFTGTAMRKGHRLITVVLGADAPEARFEETKKLLSYGFSRIKLASDG
ncbi:D-alanyl-D-alanine carboxypeptidase family protein [Paenibacillus koleovorans]|uniref:D-alanyl-D-alanine carboxypeptidase family protein n=1 Tax=Paenibacillus koleovorans TaxID=121608 RepID=UPI0013E2D02A|nr:D-alanyl-D-alanine carboxypeptidase family protein [Paenibacillus koleovorans]